MKKLFATSVVVLSLFALTGCRGPSWMVKNEASPKAVSIQPVSGKSALVVSRTTGFGGAVEFTTYLNKKVIGVTKGKTYFAKTDIEPGTQYVISWGENGIAVIVNFEAGKTYYLQQNVSMGVWKARVAVAAMDAKTLDNGELDGCTYYEFDKNEKPDDLSDSDFKDVIQGAETLEVKADGTAVLVPAKP